MFHFELIEMTEFKMDECSFLYDVKAVWRFGTMEGMACGEEENK